MLHKRELYVSMNAVEASETTIIPIAMGKNI